MPVLTAPGTGKPGRAKLTDKQVQVLLLTKGTLSNRYAGILCGVSYSTVQKIRNGMHYKEVCRRPLPRPGPRCKDATLGAD